MKISTSATIATLMLVTASFGPVAQANEGPYELNGRNVFEISRDIRKETMAEPATKEIKKAPAMTKKMKPKTKTRSIDRIGFSKKY